MGNSAATSPNPTDQSPWVVNAEQTNAAANPPPPSGAIGSTSDLTPVKAVRGRASTVLAGGNAQDLDSERLGAARTLLGG